MSTSAERRRERRHGKAQQDTIWIPALGQHMPATHVGIRTRDGAVIVYDRPTSDPLRTRIYIRQPPTLDEMKEVVSDPEKARDALPEEDQEAYRDAQQSVVDARSYWIGGQR